MVLKQDFFFLTIRMLFFCSVVYARRFFFSRLHSYLLVDVLFLPRMLSLGIVLVLFHSFNYDVNHKVSSSNQECQSTFDYFTSGYIVLLFATNLLEFLVSWVSSRGTIMDDSPRQIIPTIIYVRLCFSVTELFWLSLGVKWIFVDGKECAQSPGWQISKGVVIFNWMFLIFVALLVYCSFDSAGKDWVRMAKHVQTDKYESIRTQISKRYMSRWEDCFQCCCVCSGVEEDLQEQSIYAFIGM